MIKYLRYIVPEEVTRNYETFEITTLSDFHRGSSAGETPEATFIRQIAIKRVSDTENAYALLLGDTCNNNTRASKGSPFEELFSGDKQRRANVVELKPIAHKIIGAFDSNHSERTKSFSNHSPEATLAEVLEIPFFEDQGIIDIRFGKQRYIVFAWHGAGGAEAESSIVKGLLDLRNLAVADIYVKGHHHRLRAFTRCVYDVKPNGLFKREQHFVMAGHTFDYGEYRSRMGLSIEKLGFARITLHQEVKRVELSI